MVKYCLFVPIQNNITFNSVYKPRRFRHIGYIVYVPPPALIEDDSSWNHCLMDIQCTVGVSPQNVIDISCVWHNPIPMEEIITVPLMEPSPPRPPSPPHITIQTGVREEPAAAAAAAPAPAEKCDLDDFYMDLVEKRRKMMRRLQPPS
jgi:hypothetical protein